MFASMTRKIVTIAAVSLTAATLSLSLVPAAQAGGFSLSFGGGDIAIGVMGGGHMNFGRSDDSSDEGARHHKKTFDDLNDDDAAVHATIDAGTYNVFVQQKHDCITAKKIELLIGEMRTTLAGYKGIGDADGVTYQTDLIAQWTGRLHDAEKACNKVWY